MPELDGRRAFEWGLVTELVPEADIDRRIAQIATRLASAPRAAVRGTKASLNLIAARGASPRDIAFAQRLRAAAAASPERQEALRRRQKKVSG
jgi:enoyl-CoA hydratase/carnithine racemase